MGDVAAKKARKQKGNRQKNKSGSSNANGTGMIQKEEASMVSDGAIDKEHKRKRNAASKGAKVGGRLSETSTHVNPDLEKDLVGCFVDKFFRGYGWWTGIITEYSDPYFNILYKDGSVETLTRKQLSKLLVYDDDVKTRAERDSYPGPHFEWAMSQPKGKKQVKSKIW